MAFLMAGVEGWVDKAVLERLLSQFAIPCGSIKDYGGCAALDAELPKYLAITRFHSVCILRDLDTDECAPTLLRRLRIDTAANPANMVFRVAVRQVESWLLADHEGFSRFLRVSKGLFPSTPDALDDAKAEVLGLARRSNSSPIREALLPRKGYAARTGPEYTITLKRFIDTEWSPERAKTRSPSLARALRCFEREANRAPGRTLAE